jgi:small subunit ribosomal protein S1
MAEPSTPRPTDSGAERAPDNPRPVPALPTVPRRGAVDADIEKELEAALSGWDNKSLYGEPPSATGRPHAGPADSRKKGKVIAVRGDDVFVDVGGRSQGVMSAIQFTEGTPAVGQDVDVTIEGYDPANGLLILSRQGAAARNVDWTSVAPGMVVEARVTGSNKGGLQVEVNGIRGFLPISQLELFRVEDVQPYLNQKLLCVVTEANQSERNLVLSRRQLLEQEREQAKAKLWAELAEGQKRTGVVRNVKDFGAFVDLGGADGLLPVSEMSWSRVGNPADVVQLGQRIEVVVLRIDRERQKVTLGLKQLIAGPWDNIDENYPTGAVTKGKVTRLMDFGAFVELEPGLEGLVHISELSKNRVWRVSDVVKVDQEVTVKVLKVDAEQKRIALSMKAAVEEPAPAEPVELEAQEPQQPKKPPPVRRTPLKGGLG